MKFNFVQILVFIILYIATRSGAYEGDFTITVKGGEEECFYQSVKKDETAEIEYQVIDGDRDDMTVTFRLYGPDSVEIASAFDRTEGNEKHKMEANGDIKICFDNYRSGSTKTIFFEVFVDMSSDGEDGSEDPDWAEVDDMPTGLPEETYDIAINEIQDAIARVRFSLSKIESEQHKIKSTEARDRNLQEHNFTYVNNWSFLQLTVMIIVGIIQVVTVRSLFDEHSRFHKIWKKF